MAECFRCEGVQLNSNRIVFSKLLVPAKCKKLITTQLCRLCANVVDEATYIFNGRDNESCCAEKINKCLPVTVSKTDILPKQLCVSCIQKVHLCFDFSMGCLEAEKELISERDINGANQSGGCNKLTMPCPICLDGRLLPRNDFTIINKNNTSTFWEFLEEKSISELGKDSQENDVNNKTCDQATKEIPVIFNQNSSRTCKLTEINNDIILPNDNTVCYIQEIIESKEEDQLVCSVCGDYLHTIELSYSHCKTHMVTNILPCVLCKEINFTNTDEFEQHFKQHFNDHNVSKYPLEILPNDTDLSKNMSYNGDTVSEKNIHVQQNQCSVKVTNILSIRKSRKSDYSCLDAQRVNNVHSCLQCGILFPSKSQLQLHKNSAHNTPYKCRLCGNCLASEKLLEEHVKSNHVLGKPYQCEFCGVAFCQLGQLKKHTKRCHLEKCPPNPQLCYACSECKATFPNVTQVTQHVVYHLECHINRVCVYSVFKCEYCELAFASREDLKHHLPQHKGETPYTCLNCNVHFDSYYKAMEHAKSHTNSESEATGFAVPVNYLCEFCGKNFRQWEHLYIHRFKNHVSERNDLPQDKNITKKHSDSINTHKFHQCYLCEICGEEFESHIARTKHRRQEHPHASKYQCTECGKVLANLTGLIIHRRLHTGERPFVCDVCGKSFHQSSGMYTHRRIHTRECPYRCEFCGQAYNVKGDLDNHRRAKHTKERPFKCDICQKSFLTSSVFYQHRVLHTGIRKYKCEHCNKSFARWNALRLHIRTHTGEKPYVCNVCQRGFAQKGDMKKHMKTQHNIAEVTS